jgi:lipoprotein NlpD
MRSLCLLVLCAFFLACASDPPRAPVEDRNGERARRAAISPTSYTVKDGDTLFSIAWRFGYDYRELARANGIGTSYTIYPGQNIKLRSAPAKKGKSSKTRAASTSKSSKGATTTRSKKTTTKAAARPAPMKSAIAWRWPASGTVVRKFSSSVHKGIDIGGKSGDPVVAVAAGRVVYAGSGIVGYGRLLIVKHNEVYLSAYGHNRQLLVGEGDVVKTGQKIATKGSSSTNTVKLHFEIRREGKPVDPLRLLPAR